MRKLQGQEQQQQMASRPSAQELPVPHAHTRVGIASWTAAVTGLEGHGRHWQQARLKGRNVITCGVCTSVNAARCRVFSTNPLLSTSLMVGFTGTPSTAAPTCMAENSFGCRTLFILLWPYRPRKQMFTYFQSIDISSSLQLLCRESNKRANFPNGPLRSSPLPFRGIRRQVFQNRGAPGGNRTGWRRGGGGTHAGHPGSSGGCPLR